MKVSYEVVRAWSTWTQWTWNRHLSFQERYRACCATNCSGDQLQRRDDGIGEFKAVLGVVIVESEAAGDAVIWRI